jgi:hypothetical protein
MANEPENEDRATELAHLLWWLLRVNMWGFAILGPVFVAVGLLSFIVDFGDSMWLGGKPVRTDQQKTAWTVCSAAFGALGLAFVWLCRKGYLKFANPRR